MNENSTTFKVNNRLVSNKKSLHRGFSKTTELINRSFFDIKKELPE